MSFACAGDSAMLTYELIELHIKIINNEAVAGDELAAGLERCAVGPPRWLIDAVCAHLRGSLKRRRGRPSRSRRQAELIEVAEFKYEQYLAWLQGRKRRHGLRGWSCIRRAQWWSGAPHERACVLAFEFMKKR